MSIQGKVKTYCVPALILASAVLPALGQPSPAPKPSLQVQHILVVPVNLLGRVSVIVDRLQVSEALFGTGSVAARYRALSHSAVVFATTGDDIADPVTLKEPADFCNAGLKQMAAVVQSQLAIRGIRTDASYHFIYVLPKDAPCPWIGLGGIGDNWVWAKATTAKALQHELGHNLGMDHAVRWQDSEAESSDFMGSGSASLNAPHVVAMGWLRGFPGKVVTLMGSGDVTLQALDAEPQSSPAPMVAIVHDSPNGHTYYLSYRSASAANPLPEQFTKGLNIHVFDQYTPTAKITYFVRSLGDGDAFGDGPMIVRQTSHVVGKEVTFHISFSGTAEALPFGPAPSARGTIQSVATGKCLDLPGGRTDEGVSVIQYQCHSGPNQQWRIELSHDSWQHIVSGMSGKCLSADPNGADGAPILQSACVDMPAQQWRVRTTAGGLVLQNASNGLCLDVPRGSSRDGLNLDAWECHGGLNQTWRYAF